MGASKLGVAKRDKMPFYYRINFFLCEQISCEQMSGEQKSSEQFAREQLSGEQFLDSGLNSGLGYKNG